MESGSLVFFLNGIEDTRKAKGRRHKQTPVLIIMIMAMLCGKTSIRGIARFAKAHEDELVKFIPLPGGVSPSFSTIQRLSRRLPADKVCESFNKWMSQYHTSGFTAIDGKSIRSTFENDTEGKQQFTSLVSFFEQKSLLIYQVGIFQNNKKSEIHAVQELLSGLKISKEVFTLDALHCQKKTVREIINTGNGYLITVKRNQKNCINLLKIKQKANLLTHTVGDRRDIIMTLSVVLKYGMLKII